MTRPNPEDILGFLVKAGFNVDITDAKALVHAYDSDRDGSLHNTEFRTLILSSTDSMLKEKYNKIPMVAPVGDTLRLGSGAEMQLARLFMSEIHGLRFLERDRAYLVAGR
jgi:hypothetical protein